MQSLKKIVFLFIVLIFTGNSVAQPGFDEDYISTNGFLSLEKVHPGGSVKFAIEVDIDSTWHINSNTPNEEYLVPTELLLKAKPYYHLNKTVYPEAHDYQFDFSDKPLSVYEGKVFIGGLLTITGETTPGTYELIYKVSYQACNNQSCMAPSSVQDTIRFEVVDTKTAVSEIHKDVFDAIDLDYSASEEVMEEKDDDSVSSMLAESGLLLGLIFVFIGGLALNLTPCVYPLIPITISYFGGQSEGSTGKLALMGFLYVLGIALTYSVIGVVTSLSGAVFGALLQNTYVILFVVAIFIVLSLSMFGVYEFKLPDGLVQKAGGAKTGLYGAFFMGLTLGIVAAPCIGPFVLGLVTYVAAQGDPVNGFLFFFFLALGLGTPYFILAIFSGKIKQLPRAGVWMEAVKHIFGFLLLGMAMYFALPILPEPVSTYALPVFMVIVGLYILLFDKAGNDILGFKIFKIVFSVLILALGVYAMIPSDTQSIGWDKYSNSAYEEAIENNKTIIVDFYADWCIPCKELDAMTFSDEAVISESERFVTLKADLTKSISDEVETLRKKFNVVGVPTVLLIDSKGNEVERITGYVPADEFLKMMQKVK